MKLQGEEKYAWIKKKGFKAIALIFIIFAAILVIRHAIIPFLGEAGRGIQNAVVGTEGKTTVITKTELEQILEINELYTMDYTYNAVARAYKIGELRYCVSYQGNVVAGMDFSKIDIDIDEENKIITLTMPDCEIQNVSVDFGSMKYLFMDEKYNNETISQEAYKLCESDLQQKAAADSELLALSRENAVSTVELLIKPWLGQDGDKYTIKIN